MNIDETIKKRPLTKYKEWYLLVSDYEFRTKNNNLVNDLFKDENEYLANIIMDYEKTIYKLDFMIKNGLGYEDLKDNDLCRE